MGGVIWHVTMSLEGFIPGPDDSMECAFEADAPSATAHDVRSKTGAIVGGRRWYDVAAAEVRRDRRDHGGSVVGVNPKAKPRLGELAEPFWRTRTVDALRFRLFRRFCTPRFAADRHRLQPRGSIRVPSLVVYCGVEERRGARRRCSPSLRTGSILRGCAGAPRPQPFE
jgi:hypothetical protein